MSDRINVIEENTRPFINHIFVDYLKLPDRELKVLLALKSFAWNQKSDCYPSIATIGEITGKGKRQISEILELLQVKGLIRIETKKGHVNTYFITNNCLEKEQKLSTDKPKKNDKPMRKSARPPCGNPHDTHAEIRIRSNIKNNKINRGKDKIKKEIVKKEASDCLYTSYPDDFFPNDENLRLLHEHATRTNNPSHKLLSKFEEVHRVKYKTKTNDWQGKFAEFLISEKSARTYENKTGGRERYDGKSINY